VPFEEVAAEIVGAPGTVKGVPFVGEEAALGPMAFTARILTA
jgi:hypothetical protein